MRMMNAAVLSAALALAAFPALAATYEIDAVHSEVSFKVRHMMMGKTSGRFGKFSGTVEFDAKNPKTWATKAVIEAASIDTDNEKRDGHLKAADFFDVEKFPTLEFASTKVTGWKNGKGKLEGNLTMHGVTKPVVLDLELNGETDKGVGFSAKGKIDRREFGIVWNKALDHGGVAVGNDVDITLDIEALKK
ncbi:MAG: YceI family protein [Elusimicrobia bacterium]|nr:YceI family protein [Elusimicrobiota bacterium]